MGRVMRSQKGFTLVEVTVAATLLGLVTAGLVGVLVLGVRGTDSAGFRSTALQLAESQVESIKGQPYAEPIAYATVTPPNADFQIQVGGTVLTSEFLEEITVTVTHPEGSVQLLAYKVNNVPPIFDEQ